TLVARTARAPGRAGRAVGAGGGEPLADRAADAPDTAGDQCDLAGHVSHMRFLSLGCQVKGRTRLLAREGQVVRLWIIVGPPVLDLRPAGPPVTGAPFGQTGLR